MTRTLSLAFAFAVGCLAASALIWIRPRPVGHQIPREKAILSHAAQSRFPIVILGDSNTELADIPELCGQRVLNAGIAGAQLHDVGELARKIVWTHRPSLVIISVGTNDSWTHKRTPLRDFARSYAQLVRNVKAAGSKVVVTTIAPVGTGGRSKVFDRSAIQEQNAVIRGLGVPVVDLASALSSTNTLPSRYTSDDVHPNATGYLPWRHAMAGACRHLPPLAKRSGGASAAKPDVPHSAWRQTRSA